MATQPLSFVPMNINIQNGSVDLNLNPLDCATLARACDLAQGQLGQTEIEINLFRVWAIALKAALVASVGQLNMGRETVQQTSIDLAEYLGQADDLGQSNHLCHNAEGGKL